jgi:hypothetical protein
VIALSLLRLLAHPDGCGRSSMDRLTGRQSVWLLGFVVTFGGVRRQCQRPECSDHASVAYSFDARRQLVVLERLDAVQAATGVLCARHGASLVVPQGWWLDDRRVPVPTLFRGDTADAAARLAPTAPSPPAARRRGPRVTPMALPLDLGPSPARPRRTGPHANPAGPLTADRPESDSAATASHDIDLAVAAAIVGSPIAVSPTETATAVPAEAKSATSSMPLTVGPFESGVVEGNDVQGNEVEGNDVQAVPVPELVGQAPHESAVSLNDDTTGTTSDTVGTSADDTVTPRRPAWLPSTDSDLDDYGDVAPPSSPLLSRAFSGKGRRR